MAKKKFFLSQSDLNKLIKNYGGISYWKLNKGLSGSDGNVTYINEKGDMLSVNQLWDKESDKQYVMVFISGQDGKIYRKDKWNWFETIHQLYFEHTFQNGKYDLEFNLLEGIKMRKKKLSTTQKLKEEVEQYKRQLEDCKGLLARSEEKVRSFQNQAEDAFIASPTYLQIQETIKERDAEINRLTKKAATQSALVSDPELQEEYQEAIRLKNLYEEWYNQEKKKTEKLEEDIEKLKIELQGQISDKDISDDDLGNWIDLGIKWYYSYWNFDKSELVRKLKYSETISERRRKQIIELKKQLRNNRYEQYVQEDAITYEEALNKISRLESNLRDFQGYFETWFNRSEELEQELAKYAATTLPPEEAGEIVGKNIQENNKLKSQIKKKSGRPAKIDEHQVALIRVLHEEGYSMRKIADQIGCSVGTVHRLLQK